MTNLPAGNRIRQAIEILVIENSKSHQQVIAQNLESSVPPVRLTLFSDAAEASSYLQIRADEGRQFPELVLLNVDTPDGETGWALLREAKSRFSQLPVVLMSQDQKPTTMERAYELRANAFMVKPADLTEFGRWFNELMDYWLLIASLPAPPPVW